MSSRERMRPRIVAETGGACSTRSPRLPRVRPAAEPEELGEKLGMSAEATASLVTMLVRHGRVRITSVERAEGDRQ
jgi:hypothetical protein